MDCPRCCVEMKIGFAIDPKGSDPLESLTYWNRTLKADDVEIKECLKCPQCGHSEDDGSWKFSSFYR